MKIPSVANVKNRYLADRIRQARRTALFSQTSLATVVGVTPSAVAQWEHPSGTRPSLERLALIAHATTVNFEWLATGTGKPRRKDLQSEEASALKTELFAQDDSEEVILLGFRELPPQTRQLLTDLLASLKRPY